MNLKLICAAAALALAVGCGDDAEKKSNNANNANNVNNVNNVNNANNANNVANNANNANNINTGIDPSTPLVDLTEDQRAQACQAAEDSFGSSGFVNVICGFQAVFVGAQSGVTTDAELQAACQTAYEGCLAEPPTDDFSEGACDIPTENCTATVGEGEACLNDTIAAIQALESEIPSCSEVTLADLEGLGEVEPEEPASCAVMDEKCP